MAQGQLESPTDDRWVFGDNSFDLQNVSNLAYQVMQVYEQDFIRFWDDVLADVRGRGLMIGIEFGKPSGLMARTRWNALQKARVGLFAQMVVVALFQRHRILTQVSGDHMEVIKLIPPLMIGDTEVTLFLDSLDDVLADASKGSGLMWDFGRTLITQAVRS